MRRQEEAALFSHPCTVASVRVWLPILLLPLLMPAACRPPAPLHSSRSPAGLRRLADAGTPATENPVLPPPPNSPAAIVWASRPRSWDRLLIGLTHLPNRPILTAKPLGAGKLFELPTGRLLARIRPGRPLQLSPGPDDRLRFATPGASGTARVLRLKASSGEFRLEGRRHTGSLLCWSSGTGITCVLDTPLEAYLRGVVPGEVPAVWPLEAQKSLAVASRTYALASRGKHAAEGFDLCDGTHCQMYLGRVPGAARSEQAVRETRGLVALWKGRPIRAFYSADCGGRTANNEDVPFPDNPIEPQPYLRSVADVPWPGGPPFCSRSPHHHWSRLLSAAQVEAALNVDPATAIGALKDLAVAAVDASGRAKVIRLDGDLAALPPPAGSGNPAEEKDLLPSTRSPVAPVLLSPTPPGHGEPEPAGGAPPPGGTPIHHPITRLLPGYAFRRAIGPRWLKSTRFTLAPVSPTQFRLTGSGYGHGVGLCQIGARTMAAPPYRRTFRQILAHYYQGVTIGAFHPSDLPP